MKDTLLSSVLVAIIVSGLIFASTIHHVTLTASASATLPTATPTTIIDTYSVYSLEYTHQVTVRLPNGTICATFPSNRLGTINNAAIYVVSSNDNGTTWDTPVKISNATGMDGYACSQGMYGTVIAADSNNNVYVAWTGINDSSTYFQVWCARSRGSAWEKPVQVSQGAAAGVQAFCVSIAVDGNNKVHLVWQAYINAYNSERIFYANYDGSWSAPAIISTQPNSDFYDQMYPCIVADSKNYLHVVWTGGSNYADGERKVWYAKYNGVWQVPVAISTKPELNGHYMDNPCIAVDSYDNVHVVWDGIGNSVPAFKQVWYTNCTTWWSTPIKISNADGMNASTQENPSIAVDSNNRIHVMWTSTKENALFYSRYDSSWSNPVQVEANAACPHFRWSSYPTSNSVTATLDYVFLRGTKLTFNTISPSILPEGPPFSAFINPLSEWISVGQSLRFTLTAVGGTPPYHYQWFLNGSAMSGATSNSWTLKPAISGAHNVYVVVTDFDGKTVQSETAQIVANLQQLTGYFGYTAESSESGGGSSTQFEVVGSRFLLNVEANITSMSCLMSIMSDVNHSASCDYRFGVYKDNNGVVGGLVAQTAKGILSNPFAQWNTLNFSSIVHLAPGEYWLAVVHDGSHLVSINQAITNDANASMNADVPSLNFPASLTPRIDFGRVYCIFASWEVKYSATTTTEENVFLVASNSTVTSLAYNATINELSFTVSGPSDTTGYSEIFISKTLLQDPSVLRVSFDGNLINYTSSSVNDFWIFHFVYSHSTHNVQVSMQPDVIPEISGQVIAAFLAISLTSALCLRLLTRKTRVEIAKHDTTF